MRVCCVSCAGGVALALAALASAQVAVPGSSGYRPEGCQSLSGFQAFDAAAYGSTDAWITNDSGEVTGSYYDLSDRIHGFVRFSGGAITLFDVPGAMDTIPLGINAGGQITGYFLAGANSREHAFWRGPRGRIVTFDVPGGSQGTIPSAINSRGDVAGYFRTQGPVSTHGFIRSSAGQVVTFAVRGATTTVPYSINDEGGSTGHYSDSKGTHGFVRGPLGRITTFDIRGTDPTTADLTPKAINSQFAVTGYFSDATGTHGFVRDAGGNVTTFDAVPSGLTGAVNTFPDAINKDGYVVGHYADAQSRFHAFVRNQTGQIKTFDAPGTDGGTVFLSINGLGRIAGSYYGTDAEPLPREHGFVLNLSCQ